MRNNFREGQHVNIFVCKTGQFKKNEDNTEEIQSLMNVLLNFVVQNKQFKIHIRGLTLYK